MLCNTNKKLGKRVNSLRSVSPARGGCVSVLTWQRFLLPWGDGRQSPTSVAMVAVGLLNAGFARHGVVARRRHHHTATAKHRRRLPATGPETHLYVNADAVQGEGAFCKCGCQRAGKRQRIDWKTTQRRRGVKKIVAWGPPVVTLRPALQFSLRPIKTRVTL